MTTGRRATVIGAGVVGMACAYSLQRDGWTVTVIDRLPPGESTSFGNAGGIGVDHAFPVATPGVLSRVPRYLLDPLGPLALRPGHMLRMIPWLLRFLPTGSGERLERTIDSLGALQHVAYECWAPILKEARLETEIRPTGCISPYESEATFQADWPMWQKLQARGYESQRLGASELRQMEPALPARYTTAVFEPQFWHVLDPYRIVTGLAEAFERNGGTILREIVSAFEFGPDGPKAVRTHRGLHPVDHLVVAAGSVSNRLSALLGSKVPLEAGRGYHVTMPDPGIELRHVLVVPEHQVAITPMSMGLRFAGTLEFAGADSAPNWRRADAIVQVARRVFPDIRTEGYTQWSGDRPMMPDSIPVISRSPHFRNVYYAFGSGHYGLTQGAVIGRLVTEMMGGKPTVLETSPYRIDRF